MKIKLTPKEAQTLQNIASSIDEEIVEDITEAMKDNKFIKIETSLNGVTIKIDSKYTEDFLSVYGKFAKLFIPQVKTMYETVVLFQQEIQEVIEEHTTEQETEESEGEDNG